MITIITKLDINSEMSDCFLKSFGFFALLSPFALDEGLRRFSLKKCVSIMIN
ncbi:hypothetical protein Phpb_02525 [Photorhabdus namnaonensis]|uniref:Uncharacterized protein n=1 Tax=Photorhabdus namnaonensis TaxID=1851568 RepID=A0A1B8YG08_9GAMM|nr:hypothetical protein Phpb_02525 [Photorhabdus namnaonensis]